jgi:glycoside/pentoside/hexuronide:cation symporter, GPH family
MGVYAVICLVCFLITFATTKERVQPVSQEKRPLSKDLANLLKNSPWIIMFFVTFLHFAVISFQGGAGYQYFTRYPDPKSIYDVFNKIGMTDPANQSSHGFLAMIGYLIPGTRETATLGTTASALYGLVGTVSKICQLIGIMFAPMLAARFGKKAVCIVSFALTVIVNTLFYFLQPTDVGMMLALTGLSGLVYGPSIPLLWAIFADVVDFGEWKLGIRTTGIVFATIGFALKAGLAFGGAALSWVEDAVGYTDATPHVEMFRVCNTVASAAVFFACMCILCGLILNKKTTQQIADELNERRKAAEAAAPASA